MALSSAGIAVVLVTTACTQASEGKPVRIPTFGETPPAGGTSLTGPSTTSSTWTPTWEASIPAPVVKPTTKPPAPKPKPTKPPVTTTAEPTFTIPTLPGVPFAREGGRCDREGAVAITRSGEPLVCVRSGRGDALRWRKP
ncbi:hypothetical protein KIPE111705_39885 [Kibdelosporangium persicum]|uniref:Ig-like domain-containing protein n=1 Tax=Kibdelosporangium persicum TaxID=2698649 RepID=A0ABX2F7P3_9PSEU|nr:hypothetical protein [Kibdelosporangium persicum]NRN66838.1 hypothetical protein [Kibdelosporangium persicum]